MKGFFKDEEVKKYTFDEKLNWIVDFLINAFAILEVRKETVMQNRGKHKPERRIKIPIAEHLEIDEQEFNIPFDGIKCYFEESMITIHGERFKYKFPPNQLLRIKKFIKNFK